MGHPGSIRIMKSYLARSDKGNAGKIFRHAVILPPPRNHVQPQMRDNMSHQLDL